jgi:hypothetical protein
MAKRRHCKPCKPCTRHKRKGSPRFTATCKTAFRKCQIETIRDPKTQKSEHPMRIVAKVCFKELHSCAGNRTQKAAVRKYKRAKSA